MGPTEFGRVRAPENEDDEVTPACVVNQRVEPEIGHSYRVASLWRRAGTHLVGIDEGRMDPGTLDVRDDGPDHPVHLTLEPVGRANDPGGRGSASVR